MGLDAVQIVLTTEEVFNIHLPDNEVGEVETVGQLYELVCAKLNLPHHTERPTGTGQAASIPGNRLSILTRGVPETREDVWVTIVAIFVDQMLLEPEDIRYDARINADLGID